MPPKRSKPLPPEAPKTMRLQDVYGFNMPPENEFLWQCIGVSDYMDTKFPVVTVDPTKLFTSQMRSDYRDHANKDQRAIVAHYRKHLREALEQPLVVMGEDVVDGHHRIAALALEGVTSANAVDISDDDG